MSTFESYRGAYSASPAESSGSSFAHFLREKQRQTDHVALHIADLKVAFLCLRDPELGASVIEHDHLASLPAHLARLGLTVDQRDEVHQRLRCEVLIGTPTQPALIGKYQGRGELAAFLRSVATRIALRLLREQRTADPDSGRLAELVLLGQAISPATEPRKHAYIEEFNRGLQCALDGLLARERTLLRQYFVDGLSIDRLAVIHQVHRATVARWVQAAKQAVRSATFAHVARALQVPAGELESVARWVQSQLGVSLHRLQPADP